MSLQAVHHHPSSKPTRINSDKRRPIFTLQDWVPVVEKRENRDRTRDSFTLDELIAEHLGTHLDGSPVVPTQTYYAWRKLVLAERAKDKL